MPGEESIYKIKEKQRSTDDRLDVIEVQTGEIHVALLGEPLKPGSPPGALKRLDVVETNQKRVNKGMWALLTGALSAAGGWFFTK